MTTFQQNIQLLHGQNNVTYRIIHRFYPALSLESPVHDGAESDLKYCWTPQTGIFNFRVVVLAVVIIYTVNVQNERSEILISSLIIQKSSFFRKSTITVNSEVITCANFTEIYVFTIFLSHICYY